MTPRVISSMEPEICTEMLRNLTEKLRAKLPATTHGYSMVKFVCLADTFSEFFKLKVSAEGQSLQEKDKKTNIQKMKSLKI